MGYVGHGTGFDDRYPNRIRGERVVEHAARRRRSPDILLLSDKMMKTDNGLKKVLTTAGIIRGT